MAQADRTAALSAGDLERLAIAAYLTGRDEASLDAWSRAHQGRLHDGQLPGAARCAFWIALQLLAAGEWARAGGWLGTAQHLLDRAGGDHPEQGLLLVLSARRSMKERNLAAARDATRRALELGERFGDDELRAFGLLSQGLLHARAGEAGAAAAVFDEAMVSVTTRDLSPIAVGTVYCGVIEGCYEMIDVSRAREWTAALSAWCAAQPDLVPFRGRCLVHRVETMRLTGAWTTAVEEAARACGLAMNPAAPADPPGTAPTAADARTAGAALYELAEIHRMRGAFGEAEVAYRQASQHGRQPEPGMALLRLAQGRLDAAASSIRRLLDAQQPPLQRANVLAACVEIMSAARDARTARVAANELSAMATTIDAPYLRALSLQAEGCLRLAAEAPKEAAEALRAAWLEWQALEAPYEAARVRTWLGRCCRLLGDHDAAAMELDAALCVFRRLGAAPAVEHVNAQLDAAPASPASCLTARELQVIRLIAAGRTNRAIAAALAISERTVDRHVSNILTKLDLPSRSAATAYAYEHNLLGR
jgi:DNA-binding NarL/FixJ family response regulator